jgi:hypothetical protein
MLALTTLTSLALLSIGATALAVPEEAKTLQTRATSPISVEAACNIQHGTSFSAVTKGNGCNDWVCARGSERYSVDLNEWCQGTRGGRAYASCNGDVYDWVCNY